jgi:transcriptional regulator GlxA family with amidase domain
MNVAVLAYFDVLELDLAGPITVFRTANRYAEEAGLEGYEVFTLARSRASIKGAGGLVMTPTNAFMGAPDVDAIIIPGGPGAEKAGKDPVTRDYLRGCADRLRYLASVSTGAFVLGEAGFLEGLTVTTWPALQEQLWKYEPLDVVNARVVKNPNGRYLSAGVTHGLDLSLEIVAETSSLEVAQKTAAHLSYAWEPI